MNACLRPVLLAALLLLGPTGCVSLNTLTFGLVGEEHAALERVTVEAAADANTDMATALDLVFVLDQQVARRLPDDAPTWFARRTALAKAYPDALAVVSLEIPPGRTVRDLPLPEAAGAAIAVRAYANYVAAPGQVALDLTGTTAAVIRLLARDVVLQDADTAQGEEG